jgi:CheY-like chemotaxis protein
MELIHQAVGLDPDFGQAYGHLAYGAYCLLAFEWADDRDDVLRQGIADAGKGIAIEHRDYYAHHALGRLSTIAGDHAAAVRALETSVSINPNFARGYHGLAEAHVYIDLVMPDIDGIELVQWVAEREAPPRVIVTTGFSPKYATLAKKLGEGRGLASVTTLIKPVKPNRLRRALGDLETEPAADPHV